MEHLQPTAVDAIIKDKTGLSGLSYLQILFYFFTEAQTHMFYKTCHRSNHKNTLTFYQNKFDFARTSQNLFVGSD